MNEVLKYEPIIQQTITSMNIKRALREELTQECYVALLEAVDLDEEKVAAVCKSTTYRFLRDEDDNKFLGKWKTRKRLVSLTDPQIWNQAIKIALDQKDGITESELQEAILKLDWEDYRVIYSLYVDGRTLEQTMADLGLTKKAVRVRQARGIRSLKKHFEVADGRP